MVDTLAQAYLRCPTCAGGDLDPDPREPATVVCTACRSRYERQNGIWDLVTQGATVGAGSARDASQGSYWEGEQEIYRAYDHLVARGFARQRADYVRRHVPLDQISSAIDVGAGNGISTHCLEPDIETLFSVDRSWRLLSQSPARLRIRGDAYRLPFKDKCVDMVYSWELLHHVEKPRAVLAEMGRVARRFVLFFEPNRWNPAQMAFAAISPADRPCLRNTRRYFRREIAPAGLEIVRHRTVGWYTPNVPPVWLYRVLKDLPFEVPGIGLSHFFLLRCPDPGRPGAMP